MISARFRSLALLPAAMLVVGIVGAQAPPAPPSATPTIPRTLDIPNGALVAPGDAPELDLLYTGDVIGYLEPCG